MPDASFNKFNAFVEFLAEGVSQLGESAVSVVLTNTAPSAAQTELDLVTNHPAPAAANGYAPVQPSITSSEQTAGVYKLVLGDAVFTADGGNIGPFRYAILMSGSGSNADPLIGWYDYGSSITLGDGETFTLAFDPDDGVLTLT